MEWTEEQIEVGRQFYLTIARSEVNKCESLCEENPWIVRDHNWQGKTWIGIAATKGSIEIMELLLRLGFDVNALCGGEKATALGNAVMSDHFEMAELLLKQGANPNLSRPLVSAVNERKPAEVRLAFVKLLVENGADVNRTYEYFGDADKLFTVLEWTSDDSVKEYLQSVGAKTAADVL